LPPKILIETFQITLSLIFDHLFGESDGRAINDCVERFARKGTLSLLLHRLL